MSDSKQRGYDFAQTDIKIGDHVRSFDFAEIFDGVRHRDEIDGPRACFVEGEVIGFREMEGCTRYEIRVTRQIFAGEETPADRRPVMVFPPMNGTPKLLGDSCCGVDVIESDRAFGAAS